MSMSTYIRTLTPILLFLIGFFALPVHASDEIDADIRFLYVQPGQTLHNIVVKLYPQRSTQWARIKSDIVRLNPQAFVDGDETLMKSKVRLELPYRVVIKPTGIRKLGPKKVGTVYEVRGQAFAVGRNKVSRKLDIGTSIFLGDKLITGEDGFLRLRMIDNALLDLRCYSIMVVEDYALKPAQRRSVLNLLQGTLRKITGDIGKSDEDVYELKTPIANVGVRGTEYALRVFQSRGCDGSVATGNNGLYLKVLKGVVDVASKQAVLSEQDEASEQEQAGERAVTAEKALTGKQAISSENVGSEPVVTPRQVITPKQAATSKKIVASVQKGETVYMANADSQPVEKEIADNVIVIEPTPEFMLQSMSGSAPEEEGSSVWWWALGIVLLAVAL